MEKIRVQKLIAESGLCSRRKAEELIAAGKVTINGHVCSLGDKADPHGDIVAVDGKRIGEAPREKRYIMLNKPRGYITSMSDEQGRRIAAELLDGVSERVVPVGRLDRNSEGLLLFTNDGEFANEITHPSRHVSKTYRVTIDGRVSEEQIMRLTNGVELDDGNTDVAAAAAEARTRCSRQKAAGGNTDVAAAAAEARTRCSRQKAAGGNTDVAAAAAEARTRCSRQKAAGGKVTLPCSVEVLVEEPERTVLRITIKQGLNRQIRRMCAAVGLEVGRLRRTAIGGVKLGMLKTGEWRDLTKDELRILRAAIGKSSSRR